MSDFQQQQQMPEYGRGRRPVRVKYYGMFLISRPVYFSLFGVAVGIFLMLLIVLLIMQEHIPFFGIIFGFTLLMAILQLAEGYWFYSMFKRAEEKMREEEMRLR